MATTAAKKTTTVVITGDATGSELNIVTAIGTNNFPLVVSGHVWDIDEGGAADVYQATLDINGSTDDLILNLSKTANVPARVETYYQSPQVWTRLTVEIPIGRLTLLLV